MLLPSKREMEQLSDEPLIVLALGPYLDGNHLWETAAELSLKLRDQAKFKVQPLSVKLCAPTTSAASLSDSLQLDPSRRLAKLKERGAGGDQSVKDATVVESRGPRIRDAAKTFSEYCHQVRASLIVAPIHARAGIMSWSYGSFAESLIDQAMVPMVFVGPSCSLSALPVRRILYATDLSINSKLVLKNLILFAKYLDAGITLYHQVPVSREWETHLQSIRLEDAKQALNGAWIEDYERRKRKAEGFAAHISGAGLEADIFTEASGMAFTDALLDCARRNQYDLLAFGASKRRIFSFFSRGMIRTLLRFAPCPVWTLGERHSVKALLLSDSSGNDGALKMPGAGQPSSPFASPLKHHA